MFWAIGPRLRISEKRREGVAILNGTSYPLAAGDFLRLPPGTTHGFVTGELPLDMLDIHTPGCRPNRDVYFVDDRPEGFS